MPIRANFRQTEMFHEAVDVMCHVSGGHWADFGHALELRVESIMGFNKFATEEEAVQYIFDHDKNMSEGLKNTRLAAATAKLV